MVVLHADICADFRLTELIDVHASRGEGNHITIMSTTARRDQAINYGCLVSDEATMAVRALCQWPRRRTLISLHPCVFEYAVYEFYTGRSCSRTVQSDALCSASV